MLSKVDTVFMVAWDKADYLYCELVINYISPINQCSFAIYVNMFGISDPWRSWIFMETLKVL